jgi:hypothetical protein
MVTPLARRPDSSGVLLALAGLATLRRATR